MHAGTLGAKKKTSGKIYAAEMTSQGRSTGTTADNAVHQTRGMGLPIAKQVGGPQAVWCGGVCSYAGLSFKCLCSSLNTPCTHVTLPPTP